MVINDDEAEQTSSRQHEEAFSSQGRSLTGEREDQGAGTKNQGQVGSVRTNDIPDGQVDGVALGRGQPADDHLWQGSPETNNQGSDNHRRNTELLRDLFCCFHRPISGEGKKRYPNKNKDDGKKHSDHLHSWSSTCSNPDPFGLPASHG